MTAFVSIISLFLMSACSSIPPARPLELLESNQLWERMWENQIRTKKVTGEIQGKLSLEMTNKERSLSGSGGFYSGQDGIRLELRDPLGRTQYSAISRGKKVFAAYYPSQNKAYFDQQQGKLYLREFLGLGINFYDLKDLWLGILPFNKNESAFSNMTIREGQNRVDFTLNSKGLQLQLSIDRETGEIYRILWDSLDFKALFEYSEFERCCDGILTQTELPQVARTVLLKVGEGESELGLEWEEIKASLKKDNSAFSLQLPKETQKVLLR
jgi:outer membrane biogenesis lipoprotein LolB